MMTMLLLLVGDEGVEERIRASYPADAVAALEEAQGQRQRRAEQGMSHAAESIQLAPRTLWNRKNGTKPRKMLVTNRTHWEVERILGVYRFRWTGTETFHRDGKQHLGMGDCQLRNGEGHTRHMYLVMMAYSLLVAEMSHGRAREGTLAKLKTIGEACRAVLRETMGKTIDWVISHVTENNESNAEIREYLALA